MVRGLTETMVTRTNPPAMTAPTAQENHSGEFAPSTATYWKYVSWHNNNDGHHCPSMSSWSFSCSEIIFFHYVKNDIYRTMLLKSKLYQGFCRSCDISKVLLIPAIRSVINLDCFRAEASDITQIIWVAWGITQIIWVGGGLCKIFQILTSTSSACDPPRPAFLGICPPCSWSCNCGWGG